MTDATRHRRTARGQQALRSLLGLLVAAAVCGGGWLLLHEPAGRKGDLDHDEQILADSSDEPVTRVAGDGPLRLPDDAPFTLEDATLEYRIEANDAQAAVFGLPAERVRTWGMRVRPEAGPMQRATLLAEMAAGGADIDAEQIENPQSEFTTITGTWNGMLLLVNMHRGTTITVTLVDR
ncbi:MAG: hypothetical protein KJS90_01420 [Acidobacteria bacterium]|nr:hypothetical protein [Acidobacteriota bacterium]